MTTTPHSRSAVAAAAVVGGAAHTAVVAGLGSWFFDTSVLSTGLGWSYAYTLVGAVLTGAVPVGLHRARRARTPVAVVAVLGLLAAAGSWQTVSSPGVPVGPTPFGWYLLGWPVVVGAAAAVGGLELWWQTRSGRLRPGTAN